MVSAVLLAVLLVDEPAVGAVRVEGASGCPSPADVEGKLAPLLPAGPVEAAPRRAVLARDGRDLRVELRDADGAVVARRRLGAAACADLAAAAAVVIATWEVELRGRGVVGLWPESAPPRPAPPAPPVVQAAPPPPAPRFELTLGAALVGSVATAGGMAPGALIEARGGRPEGRLGATAGLLFEGDRSLALDGGTVAWRRMAFVAGISGRWPSRSRELALEVDAGLMAALLSLRGMGFSRDDTVTVADPGAVLAARVTLRSRTLRPWVGAGIRAWPIAHEAAVAGSVPGSRDLPHGEVFVAVGLALGVRP